MRATRATGRPGFTFIEVMFAVLILGFGVIMIAAMIPVAVRETQATREQNAGTAVCETGFHVLETAWAALTPATLLLYDLPETGGALGLNPGPLDEGEVVTYPALDFRYDAVSPAVPLHHATLGSRVDSVRADTIWIPFYLRDVGLSPQVAFVGVRVRNVPAASDSTTPATSYLQPGQFFRSAANSPLPVELLMLEGAVDVGGGQIEQVELDRIRFRAPRTVAGLPPNYEDILREAAVQGAAVVVRNQQGLLSIYRLSKLDPTDANELTWELTPGGDMDGSLDGTGKPVRDSEVRVDDPAPANRNPIAVRGYLIGRMLKNPGTDFGPDNGYVGPTQVVQVLEGRTLR